MTVILLIILFTMELLIFLIIGGIAGWIAGLIYRGDGFGIVGNILVGIVGSFVGWLVLSLAGIESTNNWGFLVSSVIGALIFLALYAALFSNKHLR